MRGQTFGKKILIAIRGEIEGRGICAQNRANMKLSNERDIQYHSHLIQNDMF
jgi:hypothetical protein